MTFPRQLPGICLLLVSAAATAQPAAFSSPKAGEHLRAGERVEVRWTGVPSDTDEMELLLSLDGGRRIALRLTDELPGSARSFAWTVPNLVAGRAALVLRIGREGSETVVAASADFSIQPDPAAAGERLALRCGEMWIASPGAPREPWTAAGFGNEAGRWRASRIPGEIVASAVRAADSRSGAASRLVKRAGAARLDAPESASTPSGALPIPLRI